MLYFFLIFGCYRLLVRSEAALDSKKNVIFLVSGLKCEILSPCVGLKASLISNFQSLNFVVGFRD